MLLVMRGNHGSNAGLLIKAFYVIFNRWHLRGKIQAQLCLWSSNIGCVEQPGVETLDYSPQQ